MGDKEVSLSVFILLVKRRSIIQLVIFQFTSQHSLPRRLDGVFQRDKGDILLQRGRFFGYPFLVQQHKRYALEYRVQKVVERFLEDEEFLVGTCRQTFGQLKCRGDLLVFLVILGKLHPKDLENGFSKIWIRFKDRRKTFVQL